MESGSRILITGCGYVGQALARLLSRAGHEVWILSRNPEALQAVSEIPGERKIQAHLHDPDWHGRVQGDWLAVVNLVSSAGGGVDGYRISYVEGNRSILHWAASRRVERFLYTSSTSVYSQTDGSLLDEAAVPGPEGLSPTGKWLRQAEESVLANGVIEDTTVLRLGGIYGPGRHLYLNQMQEGRTVLPGDGRAWLNLIYLKDIVGLILHLLARPPQRQSRLYNVVDNHPVRKQALTDWLAAVTGLPAPRFDPELPGNRAVARSLNGRPPNRRIDNARVRRETGWTPQFPDFRAGYREILRSVDR